MQPPSDLAGFVEYLHRDPLLQQLRDLAQHAPNADPALLVLLAWNHVALDMTSIDHTTLGPMSEPSFGEQWGPARSSRAMAMVHLAMFEAANAIEPKYHSYKAPGATDDVKTAALRAYGAKPSVQDTSISAAIGEAAYRTLSNLYARKQGLLLAASIEIQGLVLLQEQARGGDSKSRIVFGQQLGDDVADQIADMRKNDRSEDTDTTNSCPKPPATGPQTRACLEPTFQPFPQAPTSSAAFTWTVDPISLASFKVGGLWSAVSPFVAATGALVTPAGMVLGNAKPPSIPAETDQSFLDGLDKGAYGPMIHDPHGGQTPLAESPALQGALNRYLYGSDIAVKSPKDVPSKYGVRSFGGSGSSVPDRPFPKQGSRSQTPTRRTPEQTSFAEFWGYDGVALLCAPPRLYNMIATSFYLDHASATGSAGSIVEATRYLAVVNLALADAGIQAWKGKYTYLVARPVTYLRFHTDATGKPIDPNWTPLGQSGSNGLPFNTTPAFPAYPSGHAVFGGAAFTAMGLLLDVDKTTGSSAFDFVSDEFNGHTFDGRGNLRPYMKVHFASFAGAEWENAESRIWLGIHWQRDADDGMELGDEIGRLVTTTVLQKCQAGSPC